VLLTQAVAHNGDGLHGQLVVAQLALHADDAPGSICVGDLRTVNQIYMQIRKLLELLNN